MNIKCEAKKGESILDVAINNDIPIQHACGGFCACTTCHVHIKEGGQFLSDMEEDESDRIDYVSDLQPNSRLGCQAKVGGDVVVQIVNVDE